MAVALLVAIASHTQAAAVALVAVVAPIAAQQTAALLAPAERVVRLAHLVYPVVQMVAAHAA